MLNFLKKSVNQTITENGAKTYCTTQSDCLDLFSTIGALRQETEREITARFDRAWAEDGELALKVVDWVREMCFVLL